MAVQEYEKIITAAEAQAYSKDSSSGAFYQGLLYSIQEEIIGILNYDYSESDLTATTRYVVTDWLIKPGRGPTQYIDLKYPFKQLGASGSLASWDLATGTQTVYAGTDINTTNLRVMDKDQQRLWWWKTFNPGVYYSMKYQVPVVADALPGWGWPKAVKQVALEMYSEYLARSGNGDNRLGLSRILTDQAAPQMLAFSYKLREEWMMRLAPYRHIAS